jgi:hypothetical protein
MAYSAEILMNKVGGTGVTYILFNSGIITNILKLRLVEIKVIFFTIII